MTKKSYAKVNIFLKIVGLRDNYHLIASRFVRVKNLFDTISFIKKDVDNFSIEGNFSCILEKNTVYKAYKELEKFDEVKEFFKKNIVKIDKNIPEFAGLGGGSSNCATFLNMVNQACNLNLSKEELAKIGSNIGADVPFFVYEFDSANVSGIGEIVEEFNEESLNIEVITPKIPCDTTKIYKLLFGLICQTNFLCKLIFYVLYFRQYLDFLGFSWNWLLITFKSFAKWRQQNEMFHGYL